MSRLLNGAGAAGFDLDGTLIDSAPDIAAAANAMLEGVGLRPLPEARFPALIGDGVDQLVRRALTESSGKAPGAVQQEQAHELYKKLYGARLFERSRVYPGVAAGLRALRAAGVRLCCLTNKAHEFVEPMLAAAGLLALFEFSLSPRHEGERKPSPAMLLAACARLESLPAEFLYVGDSRTDILAARAAHCGAIAVDYGYQRESLAELKPDAIIGSLVELTQR
ncbi:MAG TPA: phosphoglycolate phosphatase [Candidatus Dormibacteraeota bacterium]|nr:phosphoglycolate phosphatase [Candidatus Dormibacteraeota bacterium]